MSKKQQSAQTQEVNRYGVFVVETFTDTKDQVQARWLLSNYSKHALVSSDDSDLRM